MLVDYFPAALQKRFPAAITGHPLRREIIATQLTNRAVNIAGVTGLFRLIQETGAPLARVVLAHTVARAVFDVDRLWDAVRPLDNVVSASTQVELRTEATRLAERTARWILRQPELADETAPSIAEVRDRFARARGGRPGRPAAVAAGRRGGGVRRAGDAAAGGRRAGRAGRRDRRGAAAAGRARPRRRQRAHRGARRAGRAGACSAWPSGSALVPLRELVIALPRDRRWPSMARASLRDDLAMEQASLAEDVLSLRSADTDPPEKLVAAWAEGWDTTQARSAAQLADISAGDRHELAELLVAVRTLRGLRKRRQARRLPRPEK